MKRLSIIAKSAFVCSFAAVLLFSMNSCKIMSGDISNSGGKPYELIISVDQQWWDGAIGDTLRSIFLEPVPMINQTEPIFDMMRINPSALEGLMLKHRNILIVRVTNEVEKPVSAAQYNVYAQPQIIVTVAAPSGPAMLEYLTDNRAELQMLFEKTERDRALAGAKKFKERYIEQDILSMFGMAVDIPLGYKERNKIGTDFIWISNEHPVASQGIVVYSYPYEGRDDFRVENLIRRRDEYMQRVPGPSAGSYVVTSDYVDPQVRYLRINGRTWAEMRGFWDVKGDFMGGPFVSYSALNTSNGTVVTIDCFLYSPKDPKRNMLRAMEHIVYSATFPGTTPAANQ